ncbi:hypothetical protein [Actinomadura sp. 9N407]|uniref:hypothetical protein n=1 Tax=Actinomadura sp. 9N407 TaxID=3375154 RepID=UPI00378BEE23
MGALFTLIGNFYLKRLEWKREDRQRFLEERREAYVSMLTAIDEFWLKCADLITLYEEAWEFEQKQQSALHIEQKIDSVLPELEKEVYRINRATSIVRLISPRPVREAAGRLDSRATVMTIELGSRPADEPDKKPHSVGYPSEERNAFLDVARKDLHLPGLEIQNGEWIS